jgi:hypothetical protein
MTRNVLIICLALTAFGRVTLAASTTVTGFVSDSKSGIEGAHPKMAESTRTRIRAGAKMVIITDKNREILTVINPGALAGLEGHHLKITGEVKDGSIRVAHAEPW